MSLLLMLHSVADGLRTILFIADLFRWLMRNFVRGYRNLSSFNFRQSSPSLPRAMTSQRARPNSIRVGLPAINPPKQATAPAHFGTPVHNGTSGNAPRSSGPCHAAFDLQGWMTDSGRLCIWLQQGHSFKIRLIRRFVRQ